MNIYTISQSVNRGLDTFDSAVVVAESEDAARLTHPRGNQVWSHGREVWFWRGTREEGRRHEWCRPDEVKVVHIGTALEGEEPGVVCASFNAG
jgi:hypothetical protein